MDLLDCKNKESCKNPSVPNFAFDIIKVFIDLEYLSEWKKTKAVSSLKPNVTIKFKQR
jgi:hypothetical protein